MKASARRVRATTGVRAVCRETFTRRPRPQTCANRVAAAAALTIADVDDPQ